MGVPDRFGKLRVPTNFFLASYRVASDCEWEINRLRKDSPYISGWRIRWAGLCSLLTTSVHLMKNKDAKACIPSAVKQALIDKWNEIGEDRSGNQIYWDFIRKERNNILKEYEFAAYEAILDSQGNNKPKKSLIYMLSDGESEALVLRGGPYEGRLGLDVAEEGVLWLKGVVNGCLLKAGFNPDAEIEVSEFLESSIAQKC